MFGLTKREQRWAAEQKAAETILSFAMQVVVAEVASDTKAFKDVVTERDELLEMNEQLRNQNTSLYAKCAEYEKSAAPQPLIAAIQPLTDNDIWQIMKMLERHQTFNYVPDCLVAAMHRKLKTMLDQNITRAAP